MLKVLSAEPLANYELRVLLSNKKEGIFDCKPYLDIGVFQELRDESYFRKVRPFFCGISWPNNQDLSADTIEFEMKETATLCSSRDI